MIRRSVESVDGELGVGSGERLSSRPGPVQYLGWVLMLGAALLIGGGAYRMQSNMITSGLLFLAIGVLFAPDTLKRGWAIRLGVGALVAMGAVYTFLT